MAKEKLRNKQRQRKIKRLLKKHWDLEKSWYRGRVARWRLKKNKEN